MKIDKKKKEKMRKVIQDYIDDMEIDDFEVEPCGFREYDITYFKVTLNVDRLVNDLIKLMVKED